MAAQARKSLLREDQWSYGEEGLYARVEMPGVAPRTVDVIKQGMNKFKISASSTSYNAEWEGLDTTVTMYQAFATVGDGEKVSVYYAFMRNGNCFLCFPSSRGSIKLSSFICTMISTTNQTGPSSSSSKHSSAKKSDGSSSKSSRHHEPQVILGTMDTFNQHSKTCPCCNGEEVTLVADHAINDFSDSNPFKPSKGSVKRQFCEKKLVYDNMAWVAGEPYKLWKLYVRIEAPGVEKCIFDVTDKFCLISVVNGPNLNAFLRLGCSCCKILKVPMKTELKDGIVRILLKVRSTAVD